jgi:hypothetical protein
MEEMYLLATSRSRRDATLHYITHEKIAKIPFVIQSVVINLF